MNTTKQSGQWHASAAILLLVISTCLMFIPILILGLFKLIPIKKLRLFCSRYIDAVVTLWCSVNNGYIRRINISWDIEEPPHLNRKESYLIIANHQSWLDIVVLQYLFNQKIPALKFFIKDQLKWVPLLGFAWWAMGCPFMKRYSKAYLAKKPQKRGKDLEATRRAVAAFKDQPVSIVNFVEGTRFTAIKHEEQKNQYRHLLTPRAGGASFVINAMGEHLHNVLDVTLVYLGKKPSLWDFLCRRIRKIKVVIREIPIPKTFLDPDFSQNDALQGQFKSWLNEQWRLKDQLIDNIRKQLEQQRAVHLQKKIQCHNTISTSQ